MITALVPGLSALSAVVFLGEPLPWNLLAGLALVSVGIVFGVRKAAPLAMNTVAAGAVSSRAAATLGAKP
jgi:drug/metabolite transporter (DMT)-like permease